MNLSVTAASHRSASELWPILTDVADWHRWCPGVLESSIDGPFDVGTHARVVHRDVRVTDWTVTAIDAGRRFRWESAGVGFRLAAEYRFDRLPAPPGSRSTDDGTSVRIDFAVAGPLAWPVWLMAARPTRQLLRDQAEALSIRRDDAV